MKISGEWLLWAGCVLLSFAVYGPLISLPFLRDDIGMLAPIDAARGAAVWRLIVPDFSRHALFFRPMGTDYFLLLHGLFGDNPLPYHAMALILHGINAALVASITRKLMPSNRVYWLSAALYLGAAAIWADPMSWIVGIYDIGAMLFTLLSIRLMLEGRHWPAAACYLVAMLFKESAAPVGIAAALCVCCSAKQYRQTALYIIAVAVYAALHLAVFDPSRLSEGHPYHLDITRAHLIREWGFFGNWIWDGFFLNIWQAVFCIPVAFAAVWQLLRGKPSPRRTMAIALIASLFVAGLVPPLLIRWGQAVRYYVDFAFMPLAIAVTLLVGRLPPRVGWAVSIAWAVVTIYYGHQLIDAANHHLPTLLNGNTSNYAVP